jgi:glycosyltransferase involved in cell wall biosynthesis
MSCAFTQKNIKLAQMLSNLGHKVFLYGAKDEATPKIKGVTFVETHTLEDIRKDYGDGYNLSDGNGLGYAWRNQDFKHDLNEERKPSTKKFYRSCIDYILKNRKPDDFLLCTQGNYHKPVADAVNLFLTCEPGIGYRGSRAGMFRSFESSYIQNFTYGSENPYASINGSYYDRVIPNYFDPNDIEYSEKKEDYYLFIGRMIKRKGVLTAYLATKATGDKLIFAGQGAYIKDGNLVDNDPQEFTIPPDSNWEYIGYSDVEKRKKLMAHARAVFVPTEYLECFGGVHIEAMLSGTPVITTNFGVFPETIPDIVNGKVGFRCNTLQDFVNAVKNTKKGMDSNYIRKYAERFLMENVAKEYEKWFSDLYQVYLSTDGKTKGWSYVK